VDALTKRYIKITFPEADLGVYKDTKDIQLLGE